MDKKSVFLACASCASAFLLVNYMKKRGKKFWVYPDHDNTQSSDQKESPNAAVDHAEKGLTELDAAHRSEWVSMGYPLTYHDLDEDRKPFKK
jgi:cellobiose-specific phosphotransferase system component IIB